MTKDSDRELVDALAAHPHDLETWSVWGDKLQEAGDPRGTLVVLCAKLAQSETQELLDYEQTLLEENAEAFFGPFVTNADWRDCFEWSLHMGYWGRIKLWTDYDHSSVIVDEMLAEAINHESARFLQELVLGPADEEGNTDYSGCCAIIAEHRRPSIRKLFVGDFCREDTEISWVFLGHAGSFWQQLPNLTDLTLRGGHTTLGEIDAPNLERLTIHTGGLLQKAASSLASAKAPKLEQLECWFGTSNYGGECSEEDAWAVGSNQNLTSLRSLGLMNSDFSDELAEGVSRIKLLPQLERLDLSMGTMTDTGAEAILRKADAFKHLKILNLQKNFLSEAMESKIADALPNAQLGEQKTPYDDDYRYVSVGE